jgi:hypothetical protein
MKLQLLLLTLLFTACNGVMLKEVAHEAAVAEEAIERDQEIHPYQKQYGHQCDLDYDTNSCQLKPDTKSCQNQRQYPKRQPNKIPKDERFNHGV